MKRKQGNKLLSLVLTLCLLLGITPIMALAEEQPDAKAILNTPDFVAESGRDVENDITEYVNIPGFGPKNGGDAIIGIPKDVTDPGTETGGDSEDVAGSDFEVGEDGGSPIVGNSGLIPPNPPDVDSGGSGGDFIPGEVLAPADSLEHALEIAAVYGLELESYAYGVAVLISNNPEQSVTLSQSVARSMARSDFALPELSFNYIYTLYDDEAYDEAYESQRDAAMTYKKATRTHDGKREYIRASGSYSLDEISEDEVGAQIAEPEEENEILGSQAEDEITGAEFEILSESFGELQWHHADINSPRAWGISRGDGVVVAIIDTGIDTTHPKFAGKILQSSYNSYTQQSGIAYVQDDNGHGTHVSGIAAASEYGGNAGISGVAPDAKIMAIKANIPTDPRYFDGASWIRGVNYAVENGADVINLSLGREYSGRPNALEQLAIANAVSNGVTVVVASGNERERTSYPAAYPEAIAVSSVKQGGIFDSDYSNYGPEIDISAPGTDILSTMNGGGFNLNTGTSMASPVVAGVVALIKYRYPDYTPEQIRELICGTAKDAGAPGLDDYYGYGIVNAYAALVGIDTLHEVTIDFNDGVRAPAVVRVVPGDKLTEPAVPAREGYGFDGWYTSANGNVKYNFDAAVNSSFTIYAKWVDATSNMYVLEFPDSAFRSEVLRMLNEMDGGDRKEYSLVTADTALLASFKELFVYNMGIRDLTGIKHFTGVEMLLCYTNQLTELDVSGNVNLKHLNCGDNRLTRLDISKNANLIDLVCYDNQLKTLDVSKNTKLDILDCYYNQLAKLDVTKNVNLTVLDCSANQLTELDVSKNTKLAGELVFYDYSDYDVGTSIGIGLSCWGNQLTELDLSKNTGLKVLDCSYNNLESLDLSKNTKLEVLMCEYNRLKTQPSFKNPELVVLYMQANRLRELDLSECPALEVLLANENLLKTAGLSGNRNLEVAWLNVNRLTGLDVSDNIALKWIDCRKNYIPSKDDITGLDENRTELWYDPQNPPLGNAITGAFTDPNFRAAVYELTDRDPSSEEIYEGDVARIEDLSLHYSDIKSLAGLEYFTSLEGLYCVGNQLEELPALPSTLKALYFGYNPIKTMPVLPDGLEELGIYGLQLAALPALPNGLTDLFCNDNLITALPMLPAALKTLDISYNPIANMPVWPSGLITLGINGLKLTGLSGLPDGLITLWCDGNQLTGLPDLPNGIENLSCSNNLITRLDNLPPTLRWLYCGYNRLTGLPDLPNHLVGLWCQENRITKLPALPATLEELNCSNNQLTGFDVTGLLMQYIDCSFNNIKSKADVKGFTGIWDEEDGQFIFSPQNDGPVIAEPALSALAVSAGSLYPAFSPEVTNYTVTVSNSVSSITITAETNHENTTIEGAGTKSLAVGANLFDITLTRVVIFMNKTYTFTRTYTVTVTREQQTGGTSGSGGGGGGGGGRTTTAAPQTPATTWLEKGALNILAGGAKASGKAFVRTSGAGVYGVRAGAFAGIAGLRYEHDTIEGNVVQVRISVNNPELFTKETMFSAWLKGASVDKIKAFFEKWFKNKVRVIYFDQKDDWGQPVQIAAKVDFTGMDVKNLYFYSYDSKTNAYRRIADPGYRIDKNGYLCFTTPYAGSIIISEGPLMKKGQN